MWAYSTSALNHYFTNPEICSWGLIFCHFLRAGFRINIAQSANHAQVQRNGGESLEWYFSDKLSNLYLQPHKHQQTVQRVSTTVPTSSISPLSLFLADLSTVLQPTQYQSQLLHKIPLRSTKIYINVISVDASTRLISDKSVTTKKIGIFELLVQKETSADAL